MTLSELEKLRKSAKLLFMLNMAIVILATPFWPSPLSFALLVGGGILFFAVVHKKMKDYKLAFKNNIVKASLSEVFSELFYEPDRGVDIEEVENSALIQFRDEYHSNDLIKATYGKVKFKQADIVIMEKIHRVGKDGMSTNEDTKTCFTGRFLVFNFLKQTKAPVRVMGKSFNPDGFNQGIVSAVKTHFAESQNQVFMESEQFNKNFNVFCTDGQAAFYILTPQIVEAITMLSDQYQGKIALCFRDEKLYVAISSKNDSLEANLFANRTIWKEQQLVLKDIKVITDFITLMNLENNSLVTTSNN
ncbi:MAG: DUF3137 domain-containing protein [Candidatus Fimivivens sp.]|nr:DUF3137 domain-containing protein [Candidatus Fimivivens sp.]